MLKRSLADPTKAPFRTLCMMALVLSLLSAKPAAAIPPIAPPHGTAATTAGAAQAGFSPLDPTPPTDITPDQIIQKFGEREAAFARARNEYTFRQSVTVSTIDDDTGKPDGQYRQVTDIVFSESGARTEHVVFAPANTIQRVIMTQADFDDIEHRLPFVLTTPELPQYNLTYLGRQKVDDIQTYVFDCKPKTFEKGKRYFQGKVWVDQQEFEIVLINGKAVPDDTRPGHADLSPPYTTYYQEIDAGNWFPVYTKADGTLHFPAQNGAMAENIHLRYTVKYEDYKRFHAKSRIIFNGDVLDTPQATPAPTTPGAPPATPIPPDPSSPATLPPPDPDAPSLTRPKPPAS